MVPSLVALVMALALAPGHVSAQDDAGRLEEARELFDRGLELSDQGRWGEAITYFQQSRELVPRPSSTYNLAVALYHVGRPIEATRRFEEYLATDDAQQDRERAGEARRYLRLMRTTIGTIALDVTPADAEVRVDGRTIEGRGREREVQVDPGTRALRIEASGYRPLEREVDVDGGGRVEVVAALEPAGADLTQLGADEDPEGGLLSEPLFWVAAVVVIAAAVGATIFLTTREDPYDGSTGVVIRALGDAR